jgi:hypothetical protein
MYKSYVTENGLQNGKKMDLMTPNSNETQNFDSELQVFKQCNV